jgi:hypothetical protein
MKCKHKQGVLRYEWSGFTGTKQPVFGCLVFGECVEKRINEIDYARCIGCNRFEKATAESLQPTKAESTEISDELFCVHRRDVAYVMQAGSRPCVKRPITVWNCSVHGQCSLRQESCLDGKVTGCSTCNDLTHLVQINENDCQK